MRRRRRLKPELRAPRRASRRCSPRAPSRMCRCAPAGSRWPCSRLRGIRGRSGLTTRVSPSCSASPPRRELARATLDAWRAQAHAEAEKLHATLEASLLPVMPIAHSALEIVTAYRPGEDRLLLGGDFYDVMPLPDGRLALILGDVAGHGPSAAALGARLRAGWQALTLSGTAPSAILNSLTRMVAAQPPLEQFATVVLAWIDPAARSAALLSAGHPPPLLLLSAVQPIHLPAHLPLGLDESSRPRPTTVKLPPGWTLFFYTDGLIEGRVAPGSPQRYGEDRLARRLQEDAAGFDAAALQRVLADVETANGAAFADDVAVVAVSEKRAEPRPAKTF